MLASNHAYELINNVTSTCLSTLDRWTLGNKYGGLNRCRTHLNIRSKIIYKKYLGFYSDKYGKYLSWRWARYSINMIMYTQADTVVMGESQKHCLLKNHCIAQNLTERNLMFLIVSNKSQNSNPSKNFKVLQHLQVHGEFIRQ